MKLLMLFWCVGITHVFAQSSGAESLQRSESGILGASYFASFIPLLTHSAAFFYGEKIAQTDIHTFKILYHGTVARQNFLLGFEQEHSGSLQKSDLSLGFGKKISRQVTVGLKIGYNGIHARGYGSKGSLHSGLGLFFRATDKINWAFQLNHLERLTSTKQWNTFTAKTGVGWIVSNICGLSIAVEALESKSTNIEMGLYYKFRDKARMRMEFQSNIPSINASIGYLFPFIDVEVFSKYQMTGSSVFGIGIYHQIKRKS